MEREANAMNIVPENIYIRLLKELKEGKRVVLITTMQNENGRKSSFPPKLLFTEKDLLNLSSPSLSDSELYGMALSALETGNLLSIERSPGERYLIEPFFPEPRLIVFGGGHIAKPLVALGAMIGFLVTVIDDRPSFANRERFPLAQRVLCESFDKCFDQLNLNGSAYVVIVTRGHRHDLDCLRGTLKYTTAYVGMIGSKRRVRGVREILLKEGFPEELVEKVNAPIGVPIGAATPEEIAISIIAQVIRFRRIVKPSSEIRDEVPMNWPELDREVLEELSRDEDDPKAIVTIVSTKGSVPRKTGAKMLVWPYGKTLGSIGGGCSEGKVIRTAQEVIRSGEGRTLRIDMTGDLAEEEGMVCGGIMDVIIEPFGIYKLS